MPNEGSVLISFNRKPQACALIAAYAHACGLRLNEHHQIRTLPSVAKEHMPSLWETT